MSKLARDFEIAFSAHPELLEAFSKLNRPHFFITGGTGFFGCWLLESLVWLREKYQWDLQATVLTRDPARFVAKCPHLANHTFIRFHTGDICDFKFPQGQFTHLIHAATEASAQLNSENPLLMFDTITDGTRRALDFAVHGKISRFLLVSSGAVYGKQGADVTHVSESDRGGPDSLSSQASYAEGKRVAEYLCGRYSDRTEVKAVIARCFAFVGPYLPLDIHFAIGNFIRDAKAGGPIVVKGDGTPLRSYLYGADLVVWLWTSLLRGIPGRAYNVGSEDAISIADLARTVAEVISPQIEIKKGITVPPDSHHSKALAGALAPERYVPSTQRARTELKLKQTFDLRESIRRTAEGI